MGGGNQPDRISEAEVDSILAGTTTNGPLVSSPDVASPAAPIPPALPVMPIPYARPAEYQAAEQGWLWEYDQLVVPLNVELPPRCAKCGQPGARRHVLKLYWMNPLFLLLILLNWLVLLIVYLFVRKTGVIALWLCPVHEKKRQGVFRIAYGIGALSGVIFVGSMIWMASLKRRDEWMSVFGFIGSLLVALAAVLVGMYGTRIVRPTKMDAYRMWLKAVSPEALR